MKDSWQEAMMELRTEEDYDIGEAVAIRKTASGNLQIIEAERPE